MEIYEENAISTRSYNLRVLNLRERGRLGSLKLNRVRSGGGDDEDDALVERQLLYRKLPDQHLLNLSVLKLDGSLFGETPPVLSFCGAFVFFISNYYNFLNWNKSEKKSWGEMKRYNESLLLMKFLSSLLHLKNERKYNFSLF